jgi:hypothetical protein
MTDTARPLDLLGEDAMQLGHTINMVADLPRYLHEGYPLHAHVRHAVAESFAINAALLARFIEQHPRVLTDDDVEFLDEVAHTVEAHVTTYGTERRDDPLPTVPAREWRTRLFTLLDKVPLPEPLATWRIEARWLIEHGAGGTDTELGEWKP